jgi:hypothetical protein
MEEAIRAGLSAASRNKADYLLVKLRKARRREIYQARHGA